MQFGALMIVVLASAWLVLVSWLMWNRPNDCLRWLGLMASTWQINVTELGLRGLVGAALVVRSASAKVPDQFELVGWFVLFSSIFLLLIPRKWHAAYAVWRSEKLSARFVKLMSPPTAALALLLTHLAI